MREKMNIYLKFGMILAGIIFILGGISFLQYEGYRFLGVVTVSIGILLSGNGYLTKSTDKFSYENGGSQ